MKADDGEPTGELQEFAAMFPISRLIGNIFRVTGTSESGLRMFGQIAQLAGVTTATDLVNDLADESVELLQRITAEDDYPVRIVPAYLSLDGSVPREAGAARVRERMARNTDKLHFGAIKIVVDGSIQGFTARLRWPGYFNGHENGIWIASPAELTATIEYFHAEGLQLHIHTNGDEATELAIDAVEAALRKHPRADHRHTLQHCQMADAAQFRRMARLGICVNLFANHLYYWGDAHYALTMGPDRAYRMDACATALRARRAAGDPFRRTDHAARPAVHRLVRRQPAHLVGPRARRKRTHRRARRAVRDHHGRGVHARPRRPHRLDRGRQVRRLLRARRRSASRRCRAR